MQNDLIDGVNWMIKLGIANPKKIAIMGGSYGGYATLAGVKPTESEQIVALALRLYKLILDLTIF